MIISGFFTQVAKKLEQLPEKLRTLDLPRAFGFCLEVLILLGVFFFSFVDWFNSSIF